MTFQARPGAHAEDEGGRMVAGELEAAEALAAARSSSLRSGAFASGVLKRAEAVLVASISQSQDQPVAAEKLCDYVATATASPEKTDKIVEKPSQLCSTSNQSNPVTKSRQKLTQAEKEERKTRCILANRESARKTSRRRHAMYLELTRKAAEVLEENGNLKKQKEQAVEEYNSLEGRNKFLKAQLSELKKGEAGEKEEELPETSMAEKSCPAIPTATICLHNQPSVVPCFWPSIIPSPYLVPSQCACPSHNTCSTQFCIPHGGNTRTVTSLFVVPVPWLHPFLTRSTSLHPTSGANKRTTPYQCTKCSCHDSHSHEDNQLSSQMKSISTESGQYGTRPPPAPLLCQVCSVRSSPSSLLGLLGVAFLMTLLTSMSYLSLSIEHMALQGGVNKGYLSPKNPEDVFAATVARRRRKELMKLRNVHCHDGRTCY